MSLKPLLQVQASNSSMQIILVAAAHCPLQKHYVSAKLPSSCFRLLFVAQEEVIICEFGQAIGRQKYC